MDWQHFLLRVNDVLTAGLGATAFGLMLYLLFYNRRSRVARVFSGLLGCVVIVYLGDLLTTDISAQSRASVLLRLQWLGIAFTPAFYLEFARTIQLSVMEDRFPTGLRMAGFVISGLVAIMALFTDWIVDGTVASAGALHLRPGPLFLPFALLYAVATLWGLRQMLLARRRCYTHAARRRMTYLLISFTAPALGVFPYLLLSGWPRPLPSILFWLLLVLGNLAIALMLVLMAYSVAFIGAFTPDRVIKHRMIRFLLRGPVSAILALIAFGLGLTLEPVLELGQYTLSLIALAGAVILAQLGIELGKPLIDLALYRGGQPEVAQVQALSQRLLTTADLRQFLENVLSAICELLRSDGGFIAILEDGELRWEIWCGLRMSPDEVADLPLAEVARAHRQDGFVFWDGYWVLTVRDKAGREMLGLIGLRAPEVDLPLTPELQAPLDELLLQASAALEDRRLQQAVFGAFSPLLPELTDIHRRGQMLRYGGESVMGFALIQSPELPQWVHDALSHYWGGPRLTENPLLKLEVVKQAAEEHNGNAVKGLRTVLTEAIEELRPDGERKLTAPEWLLYNILEMKFLRGQKVREVARRLAVSESDFYRKQRVAIQNLADIIAGMEEDAQGSPS
jgi:hypothetical protein